MLLGRHAKVGLPGCMSYARVYASWSKATIQYQLVVPSFVAYGPQSRVWASLEPFGCDTLPSLSEVYSYLHRAERCRSAMLSLLLFLSSLLLFLCLREVAVLWSRLQLFSCWYRWPWWTLLRVLWLFLPYEEALLELHSMVLLGGSHGDIPHHGGGGRFSAYVATPTEMPPTIVPSFLILIYWVIF